MVVGNLTALQQVNVKRLLAFSGIAHAGYLLLGILSISTDATSALFYYSAAYALATIAAFAVSIPVFQASGSELVSAFNGLGKRKPFMAAMLTMALLSLAGIPPFAGFLAKYYIFSEAMSNGFFALLLIAIVSSIIGVYYYFKLILAMYTEPTDEAVVVKFPWVYVVVASFCVLLSLILGLYPNPVIQLF
jgi:NADH-quinone oxidoreductase subunit N